MVCPQIIVNYLFGLFLLVFIFSIAVSYKFVCSQILPQAIGKLKLQMLVKNCSAQLGKKIIQGKIHVLELGLKEGSCSIFFIWYFWQHLK